MSNIRAQAKNAIKDIQGAKKDLGDDAATSELLDGYAGILSLCRRRTNRMLKLLPPNPARPRPRRLAPPHQNSCCAVRILS